MIADRFFLGIADRDLFGLAAPRDDINRQGDGRSDDECRFDSEKRPTEHRAPILKLPRAERNPRHDTRVFYLDFFFRSEPLDVGDPRLLFGLGETEQVRKITVKWSWGQTQSWQNLEPGDYWELREGEPKAVKMTPPR